MKRVWSGCLLLMAIGSQAADPGPPGLPSIPTGQPFTFAVFGDNRGDDTGQQPPAFLQVLKALEDEAPALVLDTGDMIYGHSSDEGRVREQWRIYREEIGRARRAPIFHVPGNHDIWDEPSARIYRELWGPTYYAFDCGNARFVGLDTETARGRLGEEQLRWLEQQLESSGQRNVFVFLHRPLFPVDGAIGSSLDEYPSERDRIHSLFVRNHAIIRGVFAGHEHLYSFQERDGVPYYISGGGGAPLYMAPELGGFHHFILVHVMGHRVEMELKKVAAPQRQLEKPRPIARGEVLESWRDGLFWYAWDRTATIELTPDRASEGRRGLRLNFDLDQYAWPVLVLPLASPLDLDQYESVSLDVYVPRPPGGPFLLTPSLEAATKLEGPPVRLKAGWNTITTDWNGQLGSRSERRKINGLEWSLSGEGQKTRGYVVFDNLRAKRRSPTGNVETESLESFERPLLWRVFDESVRAEITGTNSPVERPGLRLHADFAQCSRPVIFAQLNPPWDLTKVNALLLQMAVEAEPPKDLTIGLTFRAKDVEYAAPALPFHRGTGQMRFDLRGNWLPRQIRAAVEQIGFVLVSTNSTAEIRFEKLIAASDS